MTQKKMTGKPTEATPLSLDDFIQAADPATAPKVASSEAVVVTKAVSAPPAPKKSVGKPPMASGEVRNKTVQITMTEAEYAALKERAGRVPISTFARDEMKENGII